MKIKLHLNAPNLIIQSKIRAKKSYYVLKVIYLYILNRYLHEKNQVIETIVICVD